MTTHENKQIQSQIDSAINTLTYQMEVDRDGGWSNICNRHIEPLKSIVTHFTVVRLHEIWEVRNQQSHSEEKAKLDRQEEAYLEGLGRIASRRAELGEA